jgi:hypothetical protein
LSHAVYCEPICDANTDDSPSEFDSSEGNRAKSSHQRIERLSLSSKRSLAAPIPFDFASSRRTSRLEGHESSQAQ